LEHIIKRIYFRCGGQGDLLSGTCALFLYWSTRLPECPDPGPGVIAGWSASRLARACAIQVMLYFVTFRYFIVLNVCVMDVPEIDLPEYFF